MCPHPNRGAGFAEDLSSSLTRASSSAISASFLALKDVPTNSAWRLRVLGYQGELFPMPELPFPAYLTQSIDFDALKMELHSHRRVPGRSVFLCTNEKNRLCIISFYYHNKQSTIHHGTEKFIVELWESFGNSKTCDMCGRCKALAS